MPVLLGKRLQCGLEPDRVQRGRAELGDQTPELHDLVVDLLDGGLAGRLESLRRLFAQRGREPHPQDRQRLQGLVVQLAGPAAPLLLRRVDRVLQPLLGHRSRRRHPGRRAGGEGLEHALVLVVESARLPDPVESDDHAEGLAPEEQGREQRAAALLGVQVGAGEASEQHLLGGLLRPNPKLGDLRVEAPGHRRRGRDDQVIALAQEDDQRPGLNQRPATLHNRLEHPLEIRLAADGDGDVGGGLQAPHGPPELVAVAPAVRDVADRREGHHALVRGDGGERDLARELAAVLAPRVEVGAGAHRPGAGGFEVVVAVADVAAAHRLRHEHLDPLSDQLVARVSEDRLGARVDQLDRPTLVDADHDVGRELEKLALERLTRVVRHRASIDQAIVANRIQSPGRPWE